ncbi:MAG TPA: DMT family transporter [Anaerolineaceae bacterium]
MRLRSDLSLLLVAMIWGTAFAVQRQAASTLGPLTFNGLRFVLAGVLLLALSVFSAARRRSAPNSSPTASRRGAVLGMGATGMCLFIAATLQQVGLSYTTAGSAGFLTSLYVVLVPMVLLVLHLTRRTSLIRDLRFSPDRADLPTRATWAAVLLAAAGVFLLSGSDLLSGGRASLSGAGSRSVGDGIELLGAFFWAFHVILVGRMSRRMRLTDFMAGQLLISGGLSLAVGLAFEGFHTAAVLQAWGGIVYTGILSIGLGYSLQALAQRTAPPSDTALILSLESVFAALSGYLFLGEQLSLRQVLGCGLIFGAILLAQARRAPAAQPEPGVGEKPLPD